MRSTRFVCEECYNDLEQGTYLHSDVISRPVDVIWKLYWGSVENRS